MRNMNDDILNNVCFEKFSHLRVLLFEQTKSYYFCYAQTGD